MSAIKSEVEIGGGWWGGGDEGGGGGEVAGMLKEMDWGNCLNKR